MFRSSRSVLPLVVAGAALAAPTAAAAQQPAATPVLSSAGTGTVKPEPRDRTSNASIARAVRVAQEGAVPLAVADARARAQRLALAAGLTLGPLQAIGDTPTPYGGFGPYGETGTFGPGRYCGTVSRFRTRRLANGQVRRIRIGSRRTCRVPNRIVANVTLTFATSPRA